MNEDWNLLIVDSLFANHGMAIAQFLYKFFKIPYIVYDTSFLFEFQSMYLGYGIISF